MPDMAELFDGIVLAAPYVPAELEVRNTSLAARPAALPYVPRHITWFTVPTRLNTCQMEEEMLNCLSI